MFLFISLTLLTLYIKLFITKVDKAQIHITGMLLLLTLAKLLFYICYETW